LSIPKSHSYIVEKKSRAVLSTITKSEVYSAFCIIQYKEDQIFIDSIEDEQIKHILLNDKVSLLTIDPSNVDRWFSIQGIIFLNEMKDPCFEVKIKKIILFPKE
jgi:hypothetical protein